MAVMSVAMTVLGWRVWYADGSVFDSKSRIWESLPERGLQILMLYFDEEYSPGTPYRQIIHGDDSYTYGGKAISGSLMPDSAYWALVDRAMNSRTW
jgi:hypothetical protein